MAESNGENGGLESGRIHLRIIEIIHGSNGASVTKLDAETDHLGIDERCVQNHVETLHQAGYVKKEGSKYYLDKKGSQYYSGVKSSTIGTVVVTNVYGNKIIEEKVEKIAERTKERAQFVIEGDGNDSMGVYTHCADGPKAAKTDSRVGTQFPLYSRPTGRALLAQYIIEEVHARYNHPSHFTKTDHPITDFESLSNVTKTTLYYDEVKHTLEENPSELHTVAVPVLDEHSVPFGALGVSAPIDRLNDTQIEQEIPNILKDAANELTDTVNLYPNV
jgi:DNA-binding IclR family transcriptional regulator